MTVCIAAICDKGESVIAMADRMLTVGAPTMLEIEHDRPKIDVFDGTHLVMSSGDALVGTEILSEALHLMQHGPKDVSAAVKAVTDAYQRVRLSSVERQQLGTMGYTIATFQQEGLKQLGPQMMAALLQMMQQFNLNLDAIVAGFDQATGRVAVVSNPGTSRWLDRLGFAAIGSGHNHALTTMLSASYSTSQPLEEALFEVFCAKKAAEKAPGVGEKSDIAIIKGGKIAWAPDALIKELSKLHSEHSSSRGKVSVDRVKELFPPVAPASQEAHT